MSTNRVSPNAGYVDTGRLPKGPNGRALCRNCGVEVPKGRRSFCGDACVDSWLIRTDPARMRAAVFKRDQGICALCGFDAKDLERELRCLRGFGEQMAWYGRHSDIPVGRTTFWDADHILPVVEGGGECGLDNIRTLCIPCHKRVTKELAARRAARRHQEKWGHVGVQASMPLGK